MTGYKLDMILSSSSSNHQPSQNQEQRPVSMIIYHFSGCLFCTGAYGSSLPTSEHRKLFSSNAGVSELQSSGAESTVVAVSILTHQGPSAKLRSQR